MAMMTSISKRAISQQQQVRQPQLTQSGQVNKLRAIPPLQQRRMIFHWTCKQTKGVSLAQIFHWHNLEYLQLKMKTYNTDDMQSHNPSVLSQPMKYGTQFMINKVPINPISISSLVVSNNSKGGD